MIKIFEIENHKDLTKYIYQNVNEDLNIIYKNGLNVEFKKNSILILSNEIEKLESRYLKTRIVGFEHKINSSIITIKEYNEMFPNEIVDVSKYEFINPSWKLSQFHKEHKLKIENFHESFEIPEPVKYKKNQKEFSIIPILLDDNSVAFRGTLKLEDYDSIKHLDLKNVYSYDFEIVKFGLSIQLETLKLVQKDLEILQGLKIGLDALRMLKI